MRTWNRISKVKSSGAIVLAALVALATVSPGGAFTSNAASESVSDAFGYSFDAFVSALADDAVETEAVETEEAPEAETGSGSSTVDATVDTDEATPEQDAAVEAETDHAAVVAQVNNIFKAVEDVQDIDTSPADLSDISDQADEQEAALTEASTEEIIAALLALLDGAEPQVLAALDTAEAAVIAKIDAAKAQAIAGFALIDAGELEAFALSQLDFAKVSVQGAFDQIRALVVQAFAEARTTVVEELTGVDFGEAADEVLAKIAEIQLFVNNALAGVQAILANLNTGL